MESQNGSGQGFVPSDGCKSSDIAIVGFSFDFPGASTVESFWELLLSGKQVATEFPPERLCRDKFHGDNESRNVIHPTKACFLSRDVSAFDARFFSMTAEEAIATDPQQRILLETTYRALENAGITMGEIWGTDTSVHTGNFTQDYTLLSAKDPEKGPKYAATGMAGSMLSNRISTFFNLTGPSASVDTACSSSLVALDLGCRSIRLGDSKIGIVAGCNILHTADYFMSLSKLGFLSADGVCHSFDERANGYGRGEGFGVLIIKSVEDAIHNGDTIRAVIRATRTNQNGRTNLAQPSKEMQAQLIQETYAAHGLDTRLTRYFEAHGTGTAVGDPLEAMAIGNAFGRVRDAGDPVIIGALKANIGHLEGAAGIAGVIKSILVLERGIIPPIADLKQLNGSIDSSFLKLEVSGTSILPDQSANSIFKFPIEPRQWPRPGLRRASVNSFGFGGTNSHVILDDAYHYLEERGLSGHHCTKVQLEHSNGLIGRQTTLSPRKAELSNGHTNGATNGHIENKVDQTRNGDSPLDGDNNLIEHQNRHMNGEAGAAVSANKSQERLMVFSAHEKSALARMIEKHEQYLKRMIGSGETISDDHIRNLAHTLAQKRSVHPWRVFSRADSLSGLVAELGGARTPVHADSNHKVGFVFTGQGSQWHGMGKELQTFPVFVDSVLKSDEYLKSLGCGWSATAFLLEDQANVQIDQPRYSQPLSTILQIALVNLLRYFKVYPAAVVGHSSGEIGAAYATGAIDHHSAVKLAYYRGLLSSERMESGAANETMMAVGLSKDAFQPYLDRILRSRPHGVLCVGCVNSPRNITVSGDTDLVKEVQCALEDDGVFNRILRISVAYHSRNMETIEAAYRDHVGIISPGTPPPVYASMISSVTGGVVAPKLLRQCDYWCRNLVSPVLFSDAITRIYRDSAREGRKKLDLSHRNFVSVKSLLEVGPHSTLRGPIREVSGSINVVKNPISYYSCLARGQSAVSTLLESMGQLYCHGVDVDLARVNMTSPQEFPRAVILHTLPEYPFDTSRVFWNEPTVSKNLRLAAPTYNEFLGTPVPDWNPLEPRWRNTLKVSSVAWLKDHQVMGEILYPGAGMLVMAIEAINQVHRGQDIEGFKIKDTAILAPLSIPQDDIGVEIQFRLKLSQDASSKTSAWAGFALYTCHNDSYTEVCRGYVRAVIANELASEFNEQLDLDSRQMADLIRLANLQYDQGMAPSQLYERALKNGYYYGRAFQKIESAKRNKQGELIGLVGVDTIPGLSTHQTPAVIHPGSLDSMFQLMLLAVAEDGDDGQPSTWIPTYVPNMHLSRLGLLNTENREQVHVHVSTRLMSSRLSTTDMYVLGSDGGSLLLKTEGFEMTSISDNMGDADADTKAHIKRLCYDLEYKPDPTLISMADIAYYTQESPDEFSAESRDVMGDIALSALSKALSSISEDQVAPVAHLRKHYKWLKSIMSGPRMPNANLKAPPGSKNSPSRLDQVVDGAVRALSDELRSSRHIGGFFMRLGDNLDDLLYGNATLPEVLNLGGNSTDIFSVLGNVIPSPSGLLSYLDLTAHKNPSMKILEVGAGTFSITKQIIDTLSSQTLNGTLYRFSHYDAAHILSDVVESNRESFDSITKMNFSQLDLTSPDAASKYEQNSYDLIVATNVIQSTSSMEEILKTLKRLLAGNGTLVLVNIDIASSLFCQAFVGFLPEWWQMAGATASLAESLAHVRWDDELRQAGFTGTDLMLPDKTPDDTRLPSIIISSAAWSAEEPRTISRANDANGQLIAITGFRGRSKSPLAEAIFSSLSSVGVQEKTFHEGAALKDIGTRPVIIIQDQHWPEISSLDEADYTAFHAILSRSGAIHWLSDTSQYVNKVSDLGIIRGLARTLRMEKQNSIFVTTAIDSSRREALPLSLESSMNNFFSGVQNKRFEPELVQINDMLCIPRLYENNQLNQKVHGFTAKKIQTTQRFGEHNVKLAIQQTGLLDTLYFEQISSIEELAPTEIEVAVKAIGVTFKDCLVALGRVPEDTMGTECAGIVVKSGRDSRFRVGDHVLVQKMDSFRGRLRCHERLAAKIPKGMSFTDAAASVTNFVTAYHCLVGIANLQPGETVLIHSGAGGTGQAAIQIAQQRGATVFTTTSSSEKRALLSREYGIPAEHVFNSRNIAFSQGIKRLTKGRGVDVVLNSLAGESLVASWECIAPYGRFIEIGKRDIFSHNDLPMYQFARNVSFSAVDIGAMTVDRPEAIGKILDTLVGLFESDKLRVTSPVKTFPVTDVQSAFRHLQTGLNPGTVAVDIDWATVIPVTATAAYDSVFDANATYIIAGGLGGQGRSIAKWMATRGARNLVLLSRSGPRSEEAAHFVDELRSEGIVVYCPRCSIADVESVCNVMRYCQENMPPIKGCIQAAMDLRDGVFENMSVDAWNGCLAAKIAGSWNLHEQLPRNLDFFILFSSVSGLIGSQGQANYAAGNTYQDELAQFRLDRGEKAVSLNLGPLEDAGFVAENLGMAERLINMRSVMMLSQEEVFALLDYYCNPDLPVSSIGAQLVTGLDVPADVLARGMEPSDWVNQPLFANLHQVPASAAAGSARTGAQTEQDLFAQVRDTESLTEAGDLLANGLAGKMCKVLSIPLETFDIDQPLHTYGVDSLIALEIRNWFLKALKVDVAVFEILGGSSARSLGHTVVKKIRAV